MGATWPARRVRAVNALAVGGLTLAVTILAWSRRWISDDGFINVRVIHQLVAGHGPIHNPHERVEVGTSTLWLALVWWGQILAPGAETGQVMVALGLLLTAAAFLSLGLGGIALGRRHALQVPAGLLVLAALPPVWDFATSGLETSLSLAWIGGCFAALAWRHRRWSCDVAAWRPLPLSVLIGLGPLIRPDFALLTLGFAAVLLWQSRPGWRAWLGAAGIALVVPVAYEVFRMGFYASLVPNTALAKSNGPLAQGFVYLADFLGTYWLLAPLAVALGLLIHGGLSARGTRGGPAPFLILPLVAVLHASFVISAGGDFMHARFLLPAIVLFLAPVAMVPGAGWRRWAVIGLAAWSLWCGFALRPALWNGMIADERTYYTRIVGTAPGASISLANWEAGGEFQLGRRAGIDQAAGKSYYVFFKRSEEPLPRTGPGVVVTIGSLGAPAVVAGLDVIMNDTPALGDPIGARLKLPEDAEFRVGHAYRPEVWSLARYAATGPATPVSGLEDARVVLTCDPVTELLHAVSDPLTPERFFRNLTLAPRLTFLRIPADPAAARAELC